MSNEIIDFTNFPNTRRSPPISSSNAPMVLNFGLFSTNPNLHNHVQHHQHQTTLSVPAAPGHTYETPQITTSWLQPGVQGGSLVARVLRPLPEPNNFPFPNGSRRSVPWSQSEHDLFLMGLIKYGKGNWSKIAKHFVCNKTRQQVQSYATSFFKNLPDTYVHGFKKRKLIPNPYSASNIYNVLAKDTLTLFPEKTPFNYNKAPTYYGGEASSSNTTNNYEASTSMNLPSASGGDEEVDLELRLGLN
uniref:MYB family transcription factor n=1 Tax=Melilotus albus TaxID=47082 RepID=A0A896WBL1_MELAB|nr:MYB family transcription factor [Melilotus albus]